VPDENETPIAPGDPAQEGPAAPATVAHHADLHRVSSGGAETSTPMKLSADPRSGMNHRDQRSPRRRLTVHRLVGGGGGGLTG
jgi:hypothetical protein